MINDDTNPKANSSDSGEVAKPVPPLGDEIKKLEAERDEYLNGWKRAKADFINYKKEEGKRLEEAIVYGTTDLIKDILGVLDSFDLAQNSLKDNPVGQKGVMMIRSQLEAVLKKRGVERIPIKSGDAFDPRLHEPMAQVELTPEDQKQGLGAGMIYDELVAGYTINERVIRPAKVRLGKHEILSTKSETPPKADPPLAEN